MTRRPTRAERFHAAAWLEHNERVQAEGRAMLRVAFAVVLGVIGAVALIHYLTPCAQTAALCLAPIAAPAAWLQSAFRRLNMLVLRVRLRQLEATAHEMAIDQSPAVPLHMGRIIERQYTLRMRLWHLEADEHIAQARRRRRT